MVAEQQVQGPGIPAGFGEQFVARPARCRLRVSGGERPGAGEDAVGDAERCEPGARNRCLIGGFGPEPVIDGKSQKLSAARGGPCPGHQGQRRAVAPAGDRGGDARRALERAQPRHGAIECRVGRRRVERQHFSRRRSASAAAITADGACLCLRESRDNAMQASSSLPSAANARPSFNRLSGAFGPSGSFS